MNQFEQNEVFLEPPLYFADDHIFDINFHPFQDVLACALISGHTKLLSYTQDDVKEIASFSHHKQSARVSLFSQDGQTLLTASKDGSFALLDANGKLIKHKKKAHQDGINAAKFLNANLVALGDDLGQMKIWDLRSAECVYEMHEVEESISAFDSTPDQTHLLATSLDGYLCVFDLRVKCTAKTALLARSDCMEEDLTGVCLIKNGRFVCTSTSEGNLLLFKWDYFGDFKDRVIGHPNSIDTLFKVDENTVMTGGEDGLLRGVGIFPNQIIGVLGQHEENQQFPITKIDMDHTRRIVASISHDNSIKFYDVIDFVRGRVGVKHQEPSEEQMMRNKARQEEDDEDEDYDENDDGQNEDFEEEDSDEQPKKVTFKQNRVKNVKQSVKKVQKEKLKQFYNDL